MSDLQQEQAAAGGLGYPSLGSFLTSPLTESFPFTTKGALLETVLLPDDVLLWLDSHASAHGALGFLRLLAAQRPSFILPFFGISSFYSE